MTTGEEEKKLGDKTETGETPGSKISEKTEKTKAELSEDLLSKAKIREKEIAGIFGGMSKEEVVAKFQKENPSVYKDKSYEDILNILKNGVKKEDGTYDTALKSPDVHIRLQDNIGKEAPKKEKNKEDEIKEKKEKLNENEDKPAEEKEAKEKTEDNKAEDEEPEEKKPEEKDPKEKEDEKKPEEKKEKKEKK